MDNSQTVNVDFNLSREEIARLAKERPVHKFVNFPLEITEFVELEPGTVVKVEKIGIEHHGAPVWWFKPPIESIGQKPEPLKIEIIEKKETYISPFTGRVM